MTEDAPSTGSGTPHGRPNDPPVVAPADATGDRPRTDGPAPAPPPPPPAETAVVGAPPPPGGTTTAVMDPPPPPATPTSPKEPGRPGMGMFPIALGVGLLAAAAMLSAFRSRSDGELDWSNYAVGLGATAVLVLAALAVSVRGNGRIREELVTWTGSIGILAAGLMLGVGLEETDGGEDWLPYLVGGVVVLLSILGYAAVRRGAFVVTAILGLGIAYVQLTDDVIADIGDEDDRAIIAAATIAVFVLGVTAVGWLLRTRALSGVVAGVIGVVGLNAVLLVLIAVQALGQFFGDFGMPMDDFASGAESDAVTVFLVSENPPSFDNDVYVILAIAAVLTLVWALAASLTGHSGFTVLAIAMPATIVPTATFVLMVEHPTWWGVGFAAAGSLLVALTCLRQALGSKRP